MVGIETVPARPVSTTVCFCLPAERSNKADWVEIKVEAQLDNLDLPVLIAYVEGANYTGAACFDGDNSVLRIPIRATCDTEELFAGAGYFQQLSRSDSKAMDTLLELSGLESMKCCRTLISICSTGRAGSRVVVNGSGSGRRS